MSSIGFAAGLNKPEAMRNHLFEGFPYNQALKLLFNPGKILNTDYGDSVGDNLVTNGDFHDFTMENDANVKGHWIFDSFFDQQENGAGVVVQDWSQGTPSLGSEIVTNGSNWTDSNEDGLADSWVKTGASAVTEIVRAPGFTGRAQKITAGASENTNIYQALTGLLTVGKTYILSAKVQSNNGCNIYFHDGTTDFYWDTVAGGSVQTVKYIFTATNVGISNSLRFYVRSTGGGWQASDWMIIDDVTLKELSIGNHLSHPATKWTYHGIENALIGSNPAYQNGNALELNGIDQYLYIPADYVTDFNPGTGDFTIEAWIKTTDSQADILTKKGTSGASEGFIFGLYAGGKPSAKIVGASSDSGYQSATIAVHDGTWHHIAVVFTSTTMDFYIDGAFNVQKTFADVGNIDNSSYNLTVSKSVGLGYYEGHIAEVRYSNKARTADEIMQSYGLGKGWNCSDVDAEFKNDSFEQKITFKGNQRFDQIITVETGFLYRIDWQYKTTETFNATIGVYDASTAIEPYFTPNKDGNWHKRSAYYTSPDTSFQLRFYVSTDPSGDIWYRDIQVSKVSHKTPTSTVPDYSGRGNDGTTAGSLEDDQPNHPEAYKFNGVDQYIDFNDVVKPNSNDLLVFALFKASSTVTSMSVLEKGIGTTLTQKGYLIQTLNNVLYWRACDGDGVDYYCNLSESITAGDWYLVIGILKDGNQRLYINNILAGSSTNTLANSLDMSDPFIVGRRSASSDLYWDENIGLLGAMIFDGQDGAPSSLPADYADSIVKPLYRWCKANIKDIGAQI